MTSLRPATAASHAAVAALLAVALSVGGGGATAVGAIGATTTPVPAHAPTITDGPPAIMLVVDTSGSMAEDDGTGRVKIVGAKRALQTLIGALLDGPRVGMRTYPAPDSDCNSGQEVFGLQQITTANEVGIGQKIRSLQAVGGTPTALALQAAANALKDVKGAMIVLVSDGESNCDQSPCDVAKEIEAQGIDLTVNTIGFQISEAGREELTCVAESTGGSYVDVDETDDLVDEIGAITTGSLEVKLRFQTQIDAVAGSGDADTVEITAEVTSRGEQPAQNTVLRLRFDAADSPTVLNPVRPLGNLPSPGSQTVTWTFRPPADFRSHTIDFVVEATADNAIPVQRTGSIVLRGTVEPGDAGPLLADREHVVILGDSYSSGEGAGGYVQGTDTKGNDCHRSPDTYGRALFTTLPTNLACSGAVARDYWQPNGDDDGQLAQRVLLGNLPQRPDLVIGSFGGNDIGFAGIITKCLAPQNCDTLSASVVVPCSTRGAQATGTVGICTVAGPTFHDEVMAKIQNLPTTLESLWRDVDDVVNGRGFANSSWPAPDPADDQTPIVVMPYPLIVPGAKGYDDMLHQQCSSWFSYSEWKFIIEITGALNAAVEQAVRTLHDEGRPVFFVSDVREAFQPDHTVCDPEPFANFLDLDEAALGKSDEWVQKLYFGLLPDDPDARKINEAFHPNADGYRAETAALAAWSRSLGEQDLSWSPNPEELELHPITVDPIATWTVDPSDLGQLTGAAGESYQVNLRGFDEGSAITVWVYSSPVPLGRFRAEGSTAVVALPDDLARGSHSLELEGLIDGVPTTVRVPLSIHLAEPWYVRWNLPLGGAALGCCGAAALGTWLVRRKLRRTLRG